MKCVIILCLLAFVTSAFGKSDCTGCIEKTDTDKAAEILKESFSKLAAGDNFSYELVKVNSATRQVVAGSKYVINADIKDQDKKTKACDIEVWSRPWLPNGIQLTINCPGEEKLIKQHSA